jgi:hypothetical protein
MYKRINDFRELSTSNPLLRIASLAFAASILPAFIFWQITSAHAAAPADLGKNDTAPGTISTSGVTSVEITQRRPAA